MIKKGQLHNDGCFASRKRNTKRQSPNIVSERDTSSAYYFWLKFSLCSYKSSIKFSMDSPVVASVVDSISSSSYADAALAFSGDEETNFAGDVRSPVVQSSNHCIFKKLVSSIGVCAANHVGFSSNRCLDELVVKWIEERPDFFVYLRMDYLLLGSPFVHLRIWRDYDGNAALQRLPTSRIQLLGSKNIIIFLSTDPSAMSVNISKKERLLNLGVLVYRNWADVNTLTTGGSNALDITNVLPCSRKSDMKIDMIPGEVGSMRTQYFTNQRIEHSDDRCRRGSSNHSVISSVKSISQFRDTLLLIGTLIASITFQVPFHLQLDKQYSIMSSWVMMLNSMVFSASVCMVMLLLHDYPFKPWPQISVSALFGSYMCLIKAISPNGALALLFISIPFSLLAYAPKILSRKKIIENLRERLLRQH